MMPVVKIELTEEAKETLRVVETLPHNIVQGIAAVLDEQNLYTVSHIQRAYLSFPSTGPTVAVGLRRMTGRYQQSIRYSPAVIDGQHVESSIGTNVVSKDGVSYPAVHEFGATVPAHDVVAKGGALRFKIGERVLLRKRVHIPEVTLPARAPIQHGIADRADDYSDGISAEIAKVWNEGGHS